MKERVDRGEATIVHKRSAELYANVLTKPLQGSQFVYERGCLTGWPMVVEGKSGAQPEEKKELSKEISIVA
jgi:hypothetical protein